MSAKMGKDWLWAAALVGLVAAATIWDGLSTRDSRKAEVEVRLDALARVAEARISQSTGSIDAMLRDIAVEYDRAPSPDHAALRHIMATRARFEPEALSISIVDPAGLVLQSTYASLVGRNVGERSYLRHFTTHPDSDRLFVSEPVDGLGNRTVVFAARAHRDEQGRLKAVMVAALSPSLFSAVVQAALPSEPSGSISITTADHVILARAPLSREGESGRSLASAPLRQAHLASGLSHSMQEGPGKLDGKTRVIAFRTSEPGGLVIGVSATKSDLMRPVTAHLIGDAVTLALATALVAAVMRARRHRANNRLQSERQMLRARDHYLHILDDMPALVRRMDGKGDCLNVNLSWSTLTGIDARTAQGQGWLAAVHPDDLDRVGGDGTHEYRLLRADGGVAWIHEVTRPLRDQDGRDIGLLASGLDITESREFQDKLQQSNAELEQFAYVASHDMREPLRMINAYLGLIERRLGTDLPQEIHEFLAFARDGAQRMDRLILDLLQYSRIGRLSAPKTMVDLGAALDQARENLHLALAEHGGAVVAPPLPTVYASSDDMVRLFQNLISNAIKYRQPGVAPQVTIAARRLTGSWEISVNDNGIGINREFFERIFRIFQRLHGRDEHGGGSGIGLSICKKIVEGHGGRIWVDSPGPNQGAAFTFTLPA